MKKLTKYQRLVQEKVQPGKYYLVDEALEILKSLPQGGFQQTVEVAVNLGIDPKKSDQVVRGATTLPHGTGKVVKVAVFTQGENAEAAKKAGADFVGMEDLAADIKAGEMGFDVVIASPDAMRVVGQLGQLLGPRGLMPNPKTGTVTPDVVTAINNAKAGQVRYRADKGGIVHGGIGRVGFELNAIKENLEALLVDLTRSKPASAKGIYIKKITLSTTMGPGLLIDQSSLEG